MLCCQIACNFIVVNNIVQRCYIHHDSGSVIVENYEQCAKNYVVTSFLHQSLQVIIFYRV